MEKPAFGNAWRRSRRHGCATAAYYTCVQPRNPMPGGAFPQVGKHPCACARFLANIANIFREPLKDTSTMPPSPHDDTSSDASAEPVISAEQAAFMQAGVSVNAGSCSADLVPNIVRAVGCGVSADRRRVRILVPAEKSTDFLADIRANGRIAVTFVQPSTHRSIQVKGSDAAVVPTEPGDAAVAARLCAAFIADLSPLGFLPELVHVVMDGGSDDIVAVEFTAAAAFLQTPGARAGQPLKADA
jgi:hypothetical protein